MVPLKRNVVDVDFAVGQKPVIRQEADVLEDLEKFVLQLLQCDILDDSHKVDQFHEKGRVRRSAQSSIGDQLIFVAHTLKNCSIFDILEE